MDIREAKLSVLHSHEVYTNAGGMSFTQLGVRVCSGILKFWERFRNSEKKSFLFLGCGWTVDDPTPQALLQRSSSRNLTFHDGLERRCRGVQESLKRHGGQRDLCCLLWKWICWSSIIFPVTRLWGVSGREEQTALPEGTTEFTTLRPRCKALLRAAITSGQLVLAVLLFVFPFLVLGLTRPAQLGNTQWQQALVAAPSLSQGWTHCLCPRSRSVP